MNDSAQIIQLLSEIKTSLLESDNVTLLVAFVGMVGVVVGTLFTGLFQMISSRIAAKNEQEKLLTQIKTEVITKQRQEWMDSVRNAANDLLAEYDLVYNYISDTKTTKEEITRLFFSTMAKANLIELKLNPDEPTQQRVIAAIEKLQNILQMHSQHPSVDDDNKYNEGRAELKNALIALFRKTWQKIKSLEV